MSNRWLHTNLLKTTPATLTADSEDSIYPKAQLVDDNAASAFRTEDAAAEYHVVADFGAAVDLESVFLGNVNFRTSATVRIQANATNTWGGPSISETIDCSALGNVLRGKNLYHKVTTSPHSYRYWRLSISDISNPDGFYQVGEWWLGNDVALATNFTNDDVYTIQRNNVILATEWLQKYVYARTKMKTFTYEWANIPASMRDVLLTLEYTLQGSRYPFVWIPEGATLPRESFFMRLSNELEVRRIAPLLFTVSLRMEEEAVGATLPSAA